MSTHWGPWGADVLWGKAERTLFGRYLEKKADVPLTCRKCSDRPKAALRGPMPFPDRAIVLVLNFL
jgi:hypothetical protein